MDGFEGVHGGNRIGERNLKDRMLLEFCGQKDLCVENTWFKKEEKRKVTYSLGDSKIEIDFFCKKRRQKVFKICQSDFLKTITQVSGC